ncbi:hypothetical protein MSAN_01749000 [Mycena sanguinolenta]|uniref:Uncharacterized protein n=1 Tax=Mycena sanguinolenta TaxID=230812 RepID=A0A8H6XWE5_9AGAR|nr:hypothetical protein MSAN_01749000 [Mycena sanguinolenta]
MLAFASILPFSAHLAPRELPPPLSVRASARPYIPEPATSEHRASQTASPARPAPPPPFLGLRPSYLHTSCALPLPLSSGGIRCAYRRRYASTSTLSILARDSPPSRARSQGNRRNEQQGKGGRCARGERWGGEAAGSALGYLYVVRVRAPALEAYAQGRSNPHVTQQSHPPAAAVSGSWYCSFHLRLNLFLLVVRVRALAAAATSTSTVNTTRVLHHRCDTIIFSSFLRPSALPKSSSAETW